MSTEEFTNNRPFVLSIAGLDPSAGAGLLADIKTFETLDCYGLAVNTANTVQTDVKFETCHWVPVDLILQQLELLLERFPVEVVKIGIVENFSILNRIIDRILLTNRNSKIIWDPVLKSSTGFLFQEPEKFQEDLDEVLEKVYMVIPNVDEIKNFYQDFTMEEKIGCIKMKTNLYLKGGHRTESPGFDEVYTTGGGYFSLEPIRKDCTEKHGSGCILSSALAAQLALRSSLPEACRKAKLYIEHVLASNKTLLGYHKL